jgi:hypothetical protein
MAGSYLGRSISLTGVVDSYLGSVRERRITGAVQVVFTRGRLRTQLRRVNQVDLGSESGQMFPVIAVLALVILATGVVIFWLGSATVQATSAQTAADAAALAGENTLIQELNTPASVGEAVTSGFDLATVCAAAGKLAETNHATMVSCQSTTGSGDSPYDLKVEVRSDQQAPASQLEGGGGRALAEARASTDDGAQASPTISQGSSCVAGLLLGAPFTAHGGKYGFFPARSAGFTADCEARLAGELDRLGMADKLRLVGETGTLSHSPSNPTGTEQLEACSSAATVSGLSHVTASQLGQFGIVRPIAGQLDVVSMSGSDSCTPDSSDSSGSSDSGTTPDAGANDNGNVHLVPWNGGPAAVAGVTLPGGLPAAPTASQLQVACTIYSVWKSLDLNQEELQIALDVAQTESTMGVGLYGDGSYGVFQQEPSYWFISDVSTPAIQQDLDPQLAAEMFFEGADDNKTPGLAQIYPAAAAAGQPFWEIAQDVQQSGAGKSTNGQGNYGNAKNYGPAGVFQADVAGGQCKSIASV